MRVLMTTRAAGGASIYARELLRQLAALGCDTTLAVVSGRLDAEVREEIDALPNVTIRTAPPAATEGARWRAHSDVATWLEGLADERRPDLVHANDYASALASIDAPVLLVAHDWRLRTSVSAARGVHDTMQNDAEAVAAARRVVVAALERAERIVAPTTAVLTQTLAAYPEADVDGRESVIHHGIDPRRWPPGERRARFVLAVPPRSDEVEDGPLLAEAEDGSMLAEAARSVPCPVLLAGPDRGERASMSGLAALPCPNLAALGPLTRAELAAVYRRAAVFAHVPRREASDWSVLEAALSGCPLVLGNVAALRELWHGAALFVDPGDANALASAVCRLLADPVEAQALASAARMRALRYGAKKMALAYIETYAAMLDQRLVGGALLAEHA